MTNQKDTISENKISIKKLKTSTHNLRKILPIYAKHKGLFSVTMIFLFISGLLGIFSPIFSANALACIATENFAGAIRNTIIMCSIGALRVVSNQLDEYFYDKMNMKLRFELTDKVINSINQTKMSKLDSTQLGVLAERLSSDVTVISDNYLEMMNLIFSIITNVVFMFYIAYLNIYMFLILLGYVFVLYIVCTIRSRIWIRGRKLTKQANDIARSSYFEQITGIRDVKLLNMKENITAYSHEKYDKALKTEMSVHIKRSIARRAQTIITIMFELTFLLVGIYLIDKDLLVAAGLLVIYAYYGRVESLVSYLSSFKEFMAEGEISATRVFEVIEDYEKEQFGTETIDNFSGKIEFKDVNFAYSDGEQILKGMNLEFSSGKMTAVVGRSGSGKSTILSLLSKLYDVKDGEILFDGRDINSLTEKTIHSNIGVISQSPYIFDTTIRQNLLFVKPDASDDELIQVLKEAQIYDDIQKMPEGLDSVIGENGIKISGGQKQRLAIARLLLMNSKVIVFDEATSALDNSSQKKIVEMLENFKHNKTIIIVAHRLSTIVGADNIYMIDDGKLIASGTHHELMKKCNLYKELYELEELSAKELEEQTGEQITAINHKKSKFSRKHNK